MKPVFQTRVNFVDGNCFAAAVASILELDEIPEIDPRPLGSEEDGWREEWTAWFAARGLAWDAYAWDTPEENWKYAASEYLPEYIIANVVVNPAIRGMHAVVFRRGVAVHDPMPGSPFLRMSPEEQRSYEISSFTRIYPKIPPAAGDATPGDRAGGGEGHSAAPGLQSPAGRGNQ